MFEKSEAVCRVREPMNWTPEKEALMVDACREMALFHARHCPELGYLYRKQGFDPETIRQEDDLARIPFLVVTAMKKYLLTSLPHEEAVLKLTSSGTSGEKTQAWFDQGSLDRAQAMMDGQWAQEGLVNDQPTNYAAFIYDPTEAQDLGIAFSVKNEQRFAPARESYFAVRKNPDGQWQFRMEETIATLKRFASLPYPVRLLGIPSFMFELVQELKRREPIRLPAGSVLLTGGGWKAAEDKQVTREEFRRQVSETLGLVDENMRDGYGLAEHGAPYMECQRHRMHIPVYNRVLVRDPATLAVVQPGTVGLLELITPYNAMMANLAVMTTDLGMINPEPCGCGRNSPTFTLVGRAGLTKYKGCAITATDIVKRG